MPEPNFFIVGAAKAGTTSLYHYLKQHPDIYMSPMKEPCHFSSEVRLEHFEPARRAQAERLIADSRQYLQGSMDHERSGGIVTDWDDYLKLFAAATTQRVIGEASVNYMWSRTAACAIAARIPHAKIMMVLRAPADRAFSQYLHVLSDGLVSQTFRQYVQASLRHGGEGLGVYHPFLDMGLYADQVRRYLDRFPRNQVGIWIYEEQQTRPHEFLREVLEFLEVDSTFTPDTTNRYNQPQIARHIKPNRLLRRMGVWPILKRLTPAPLKARVRDAVYRPNGQTVMQPEDRISMLEFYRADIHRLEAILGRDLSLWLN
jgi:hypothetical protein